jgi:hypothetical protein
VNVERTEPATLVMRDRRPVVLLPRATVERAGLRERRCATKGCKAPAMWREDGTGEWFCGGHTS